MRQPHKRGDSVVAYWSKDRGFQGGKEVQSPGSRKYQLRTPCWWSSAPESKFRSRRFNPLRLSRRAPCWRVISVKYKEPRLLKFHNLLSEFTFFTGKQGLHPNSRQSVLTGDGTVTKPSGTGTFSTKEPTKGILLHFEHGKKRLISRHVNILQKW